MSKEKKEVTKVTRAKKAKKLVSTGVINNVGEVTKEETIETVPVFEVTRELLQELKKSLSVEKGKLFNRSLIADTAEAIQWLTNPKMVTQKYTNMDITEADVKSEFNFMLNISLANEIQKRGITVKPLRIFMPKEELEFIPFNVKKGDKVSFNIDLQNQEESTSITLEGIIIAYPDNENISVEHITSNTLIPTGRKIIVMGIEGEVEEAKLQTEIVTISKSGLKTVNGELVNIKRPSQIFAKI